MDKKINATDDANTENSRLFSLNFIFKVILIMGIKFKLSISYLGHGIVTFAYIRLDPISNTLSLSASSAKYNL